jgi:branched-chain amino acid transport system ATP-binding protein
LSSFTPDSGSRSLGGREVEPLLRVSALVKRFAGVLATDHVSLDVASHEIHALIGPNGAGKTTLISQLSGSLASDAGSIVFQGTELRRMAVHRRVRQGLARSYQITSLFPKLRVLDHFLLAVQARNGSSFSFWRDRGLDAGLIEEAQLLAVRVGLAEKVAVSAEQLSHGEQRQLEVGLALATRPKLLLLDEPMAGMGPQESHGLIELIASLRDEASVLLVEHDMDAVFQLADRISVLVNGAIIASGPPQAIRNDPQVRRAYLGDELAAH